MWGPHGAKWRHVTRATSAGPRFVGLVRRARRPNPETAAERFLRAFFFAIVLLFFVPMLVGIVAGLFGVAFAEYAPLTFGLCLGVWLHAAWSAAGSRRERILLSLVACIFLAGILSLLDNF